MNCKNKKCKTEEYNWTVIENKVSPYSLVQNNSKEKTPLWATTSAFIGVSLLIYFSVRIILG